MKAKLRESIEKADYTPAKQCGTGLRADWLQPALHADEDRAALGRAIEGQVAGASNGLELRIDCFAIDDQILRRGVFRHQDFEMRTIAAAGIVDADILRRPLPFIGE